MPTVLTEHARYLALMKELKERDEHPRLLLHACCAPCSTAVLERIEDTFKTTLYYYNPNIAPAAEYERRYTELSRLLLERARPLPLIQGSYEPHVFYKAIEGYEHQGEKSARCSICFHLRLLKTAETARAQGFDYFGTTLSVSPHKNAALIGHIGDFVGQKLSLRYLIANFKKENGYKRSLELSDRYRLYRQEYCGCIYSKEEATDKQLRHA